MTEKKGIRAQGRPRYEPPRVVRLGASVDGRGLQYCMPAGSSNYSGCMDGNSASGFYGCQLGTSVVV